jgi:hypothetical protein
LRRNESSIERSAFFSFGACVFSSVAVAAPRAPTRAKRLGFFSFLVLASSPLFAGRANRLGLRSAGLASVSPARVKRVKRLRRSSTAWTAA